MTTLPAISTVPSLDAERRAQILDTLFERCAQLHTLSVSLLREREFASYDQLIAGVGAQLTELYNSPLESDTKWLEAILVAHPRLGENKVESEQSRREQAQLNQGGAGGTEEADRLAELNRAYERKFPGLRYLVFVNGRSRPTIMEDMQRRIDRNDLAQEKVDGIKAMCDIASDRAKKLGG
ncbi:uncharacterized protein A1O9_11022 [Exophiala aquamarina CBS 119918]|uniref:Oxo-4-hydroxy-4-carboxy-5-ureidoimidazoline decarboxylase domain-containing protein n=1 Tax=Exophiala aquamarina CBS 119918 TaxID=1182545 RepID=A0A072NYZ7_9EURO|nr:uncharacterized protein A1O9_11022 [Exophiala aquamarina CBS 119918]KEF53114.1 hypothetical protein A1O9_11022 [Exophiala aquamarina CBS 119918]